MQQWSQRSGVTADAVKQEMTASRAAGTTGTTPERVPTTSTTEDAPTAAPPTRNAGTSGEETPWVRPKGWNGPVNHGRWQGVRGNSGWIDDRPEVIRVVGRDPVTGAANPIPFRNGVADFSRWSQGRLHRARLDRCA